MAVTAVLAACGGQTPVGPPDGPAVRELRIGLSEYEFALSARAVVPGPVTVVVTNAGSAAHDVQLRSLGELVAASRVLRPGASQTLSAQVPTGAPLELVCTLPGHVEAGMVASLTVG